MDAKKQEFLQLIDRAIVISQEMNHSSSESEHLNTLIRELQAIKTRAINHQLPPSQGTLTLGLARQVADWIDPLDSPLMEAVGAIELYYNHHF